MNADCEVEFVFISGAGRDIPLRRPGIAARCLYSFVDLLQEDFQTEVRVKALVAKAPQTCQSFLSGISLAQDLNHR